MSWTRTAPIAVASIIAAFLVLASLIALVTGSPRWDDHLINAVGVFASGLFVSVVLSAVMGAVRPKPGASRRERVVKIVWLTVLAFAIVVAIGVAIFINDMSFL